MTESVFTSTFTCKFCHRCFTSETKFLAHKCKQMQRVEDIKTTTGQASYEYYCGWMKAMNRLPPPMGSFMSSKFFKAFWEFTEFAKRSNLPQPKRFISFVTDKKFQPSMWITNEVYVLYMEFLDFKITPIEQVTISVGTLLSISDKADVDVAHVFDVVNPNDLIQMVRNRQLSPWLLLNSKAFSRFFKTKTSAEQQGILEKLIRPEFWIKRMESKPSDVALIKAVVAEIGI